MRDDEMTWRESVTLFLVVFGSGVLGMSVGVAAGRLILWLMKEAR